MNNRSSISSRKTNYAPKNYLCGTEPPFVEQLNVFGQCHSAGGIVFWASKPEKGNETWVLYHFLSTVSFCKTTWQWPGLASSNVHWTWATLALLCFGHHQSDRWYFPLAPPPFLQTCNLPCAKFWDDWWDSLCRRSTWSALFSFVQAEFTVHEALVYLFPRNPTLEIAPGRALHVVEDSLGIAVALAHVARSNVP